MRLRIPLFIAGVAAFALFGTAPASADEAGSFASCEEIIAEQEAAVPEDGEFGEGAPGADESGEGAPESDEAATEPDEAATEPDEAGPGEEPSEAPNPDEEPCPGGDGADPEASPALPVEEQPNYTG